MKRVIAALLLSALATALHAEHQAVIPAPRHEAWIKRAEREAQLARQGGWEVIFIGDSITDGWRRKGLEQWERCFGGYKALNLGVSGDRTQHVLWRLDHGQLENCHPKLFVVMIGTNNSGGSPKTAESVAETAAGVKAILERLGSKAPNSRVLLLAIFPRGATAQDPMRLRNEEVNAAISQLADNKRVFWLDINKRFLLSDGTLPQEIMPDALHPSAKGYEIWGEAVKPFIDKCLNASIIPEHRFEMPWWKARFEEKRKLIAAGGWELVFMGDSITHGWERKHTGDMVWEKYFSGYKALNLGYGGDRTEHLLWRIDHGELDGYTPKLLVLMIGTNNTGHRPLEQESAEDTARGIKAILERIAAKTPQTKVLLLGVFPRSHKPDDQPRVRNRRVNELIQGFADGRQVVYLDLGAKMLEPDGTLAKEMMPDFLHPREKGYTIWAEELMPIIRETLGR